MWKLRRISASILYNWKRSSGSVSVIAIFITIWLLLIDMKTHSFNHFLLNIFLSSRKLRFFIHFDVPHLKINSLCDPYEEFQKTNPRMQSAYSIWQSMWLSHIHWELKPFICNNCFGVEPQIGQHWHELVPPTIFNHQ